MAKGHGTLVDPLAAGLLRRGRPLGITSRHLWGQIVGMGMKIALVPHDKWGAPSIASNQERWRRALPEGIAL